MVQSMYYRLVQASIKILISLQNFSHNLDTHTKKNLQLMIWQNDVKPLKGDTLKKKERKKNTRDAVSVGNAHRGEPSERSTIKCSADFFTLLSSKVQERTVFLVRPYGEKEGKPMTVLGYFIYLKKKFAGGWRTRELQTRIGFFSQESYFSHDLDVKRIWILYKIRTCPLKSDFPERFGSSHKNPNRVHRYSQPSV